MLGQATSLRNLSEKVTEGSLQLQLRKVMHFSGRQIYIMMQANVCKSVVRALLNLQFTNLSEESRSKARRTEREVELCL